MTKRTASHLRLHTESVESPNVDIPLADDVTACLEAFATATGWNIRPKSQRNAVPRPKGTPRLGAIFSHGWELHEATPLDDITSVEELLSTPMVRLSQAEELMHSIQRLVERLDKAEQAIRRQEAELAVGIGMTWQGSHEDELMADRLETALASAGSAIGTTAAALYLLDEQTSELKMRSCWGLPVSRLAEPARPLRGSLADLEALLGNAVMLEDIAISPEWKSPEVFGAAICVPIGSPTMPHGTLWFWSEEPRTFSPSEIEVANLAAARMMSELERVVIGNEVQTTKILQKQLDEAGLAQAGRLPDSQPLHHHFQIDGWTFQDGTLGGGFHDWDMNPKGNMVFALGQANLTGPAGAMVAASAQAIVRSHWPSNAGPNQLMRSLNDVLFGSLESDWRASACLLHINPETFHGSLCNAGTTQAFIVSHRGFRPIGAAGPYLAKQPDPTYSLHRFVLQPGEVLLAFSGSVIDVLKGKVGSKSAQKALSQDQLLQAAYRMLDDDATDIAGQLARMLPTVVSKDHSGVDRSLLVIRNVCKP